MTKPSALPAHARVALIRATNLEVLEARIAPAVLSPGVFTYTDADGDAVTVQVAGGFKSVDLLTEDGSDVLSTGGDVASIVVTGARPDFSLIFADGNSGEGGGDGVVDLGVISGPAGAKLPTIKGVFTVQTGDSTFELGGYKGTNFSKGGGLVIHGSLVQVADGTGGLELAKIGKDVVVDIRNGIEAGTLAVVKGKVSGTLSLGGQVDSSVALGSVAGTLQLGIVSSTVTVNGSVSGLLSVAGTTFDESSSDPVGLVRVKAGLQPKGIVTGEENLNLQIDGVLSGAVRAQGDLFLNAGKGLKGASVTTQGSLTINTGRDVISSTLDVGERVEVDSLIAGSVRNSAISSSDDLSLLIGGSVLKSRIVTSDEGFLEIGGFVGSSKISAGADLSLSVVDYILGSEVLPDGELILEVLGGERTSGAVINSLIGSRESGIEVAVAGKVSGSNLISGDSALVAAGRNLENSLLISGFDAIIVAGGSVSGSSFVSGSDISVEAVGVIRNSDLQAANELNVVAGRAGISKSRMETAEGNISVSTSGAVAKTVVLSGLDVDLSTEAALAGDVLIHAAQDVGITGTTKKIAAKIGAGRDVTVVSEGAFTGSIRAGDDLTIRVAQLAPSVRSGSASPGLPFIAAGIRAGGDFDLQTTGSVVARSIEIDGDLVGLQVGQNFDASLRVGGDFVPGEEGTNVTAIAGSASARSLIEIRGNTGGDTSAAKITFAGAFKGRLQIGGDLRTDLEFGASVSRILIGGAVGDTALGDGIAQIFVNGGVGTLRSSSLFVRTDAGGGEFVDGTGTTTGVLQATGIAKNVTPVSFLESGER